MIFDGPRFLRHLEDATMQYEKTAPTVTAWIEDLYDRATASPDRVSIRDVMVALALLDGGEWEQPNYAANRIYKHMSACGLDTVGHAGF